MCVAIYKPKGVEISEDTLFACYIENPDSMGIAAATGSKIIIHKALHDFATWYKQIKPFLKHACLIHFRIATHGATNKKNAHPFLLNHGTIAVIHNGIISGMTDVKGEESDTAVYCKTILQPILKQYPRILENAGFLAMVSRSIGSFNRMCFIDAQGRHCIANEADGEWIDGAWYSNDYWDKTKTSVFEKDWMEDWHMGSWVKDKKAGVSKWIKGKEKKGKKDKGKTSKYLHCIDCSQVIYEKTKWVDMGSNTALCENCAKGVQVSTDTDKLHDPDQPIPVCPRCGQETCYGDSCHFTTGYAG